MITEISKRLHRLSNKEGSICVISFLIYIIVLSSTKNIFSQESKGPSRLFISVYEVRLIAINNNLDIKLAQLDSRIKGTELSYKEAVFDTILNGAIDYTDDQLKKSSSIPGSKSITNNYNIGIDKRLKSGTDVEIDITNKREWTNSSFVSLNPYHESQVEITLTQPMAKNFFGLIDLGDVEIVRQDIKNAELDSYIKIENALIQAEKAYWELVHTKEEFNIKKGVFKKAMRLFNQYRNKLKIGLVESGDVLAAEANMHIRESELLISLNELKTAEELLRFILNIKNETRLIPTDTLKIEHINANLIESLRIAFNNRRDYLSKKNDLEAKKIKLKMKSNARLPEIDLKATFATNGIDGKYYRALSDVIEDSNPKYYVGIEFKYPLENNEAHSLYEKAVLEKAKAIIDLQKTERQIISDIDERFRKLSVERLNIPKLEMAENLQEGKLSQEQKKFRHGRSNSDTLIRYQEDLLNARLKTLKAYLDYKIYILELRDAEDSFLKYIGLE